MYGLFVLGRRSQSHGCRRFRYSVAEDQAGFENIARHGGKGLVGDGVVVTQLRKRRVDVVNGSEVSYEGPFVSGYGRIAWFNYLPLLPMTRVG